jgi:uncharacterized protein (DUF58 family)
MASEPDVRAENYLAPETLVQLAPFEMRAKMIVEGIMSGMHRSPFQGMAVEFAEHRQYVAGDDPRHLDWKVYGRSDKLYVKQYQQETNLDVVVLIDASASMGYGTLEVKKNWGGTEASRRVNRWTKFDHATALATAIAYLCLHQQDRVGVAVFADDIRTLVTRSSARGQWRKIVNALRVEPVEAHTDLTKIADQVLSKVTNRALFIIISDLFEERESIRQALARFKHRRHDVILLNTLDRQEMRFDFNQPAPFLGLEDEGRLRIDPRALRSAYLDALREHLQFVARTAMSFGFEYCRIDTHESVGPPLAYLLARRMALIKRSKAG